MGGFCASSRGGTKVVVLGRNLGHHYFSRNQPRGESPSTPAAATPNWVRSLPAPPNLSPALLPAHSKRFAMQSFIFKVPTGVKFPKRDYSGLSFYQRSGRLPEVKSGGTTCQVIYLQTRRVTLTSKIFGHYWWQTEDVKVTPTLTTF